MLAAVALAALALQGANASVTIGCSGERVKVSVRATGSVKHVDFVVNGARKGRDRSRPYVKMLRRAGGKEVGVVVRYSDGRAIRLGRRAPRC